MAPAVLARIFTPPAGSLLPSPTPPDEPLAWFWRCHCCRRVNRMSCTRRCLHCSHKFCFSREPPNELSPRRSKCRRTCDTEFDYSSWEEQTEWRRDTMEYNADPELWNTTSTRLLRGINKKRTFMSGTKRAELVKQQRREERKKQRILRFRNGTHDCSVDCAYPSECIHEKWRAMLEAQEDTNSDSTEECSNAEMESEAEPSGTVVKEPSSEECDDMTTKPEVKAEVIAGTKSEIKSETKSSKKSQNSTKRLKSKHRNRRHLNFERRKSWLNPERHQTTNPDSPKLSESP